MPSTRVLLRGHPLLTAINGKSSLHSVLPCLSWLAVFEAAIDVLGNDAEDSCVDLHFIMQRLRDKLTLSTFDKVLGVGAQ